VIEQARRRVQIAGVADRVDVQHLGIDGSIASPAAAAVRRGVCRTSARSTASPIRRRRRGASPSG
jgi:hypothetical protein